MSFVGETISAPALAWARQGSNAPLGTIKMFVSPLESGYDYEFFHQDFYQSKSSDPVIRRYKSSYDGLIREPLLSVLHMPIWEDKPQNGIRSYLKFGVIRAHYLVNKAHLKTWLWEIPRHLVNRISKLFSPAKQVI
ncbi:MAG: hypothetical protein KTR14_08275 [Vampirovibrio sp.]|nr:hypothetical protein [Vampirovibrio sp.]